MHGTLYWSWIIPALLNGHLIYFTLFLLLLALSGYWSFSIPLSALVSKVFMLLPSIHRLHVLKHLSWICHYYFILYSMLQVAWDADMAFLSQMFSSVVEHMKSSHTLVDMTPKVITPYHNATKVGSGHYIHGSSRRWRLRALPFTCVLLTSCVHACQFTMYDCTDLKVYDIVTTWLVT